MKTIKIGVIGVGGRGTIGPVQAVWVRHFVPSGGDYFFHDWRQSVAVDCAGAESLRNGSMPVDIPPPPK